MKRLDGENMSRPQDRSAQLSSVYLHRRPPPATAPVYFRCTRGDPLQYCRNRTRVCTTHELVSLIRNSLNIGSYYSIKRQPSHELSGLNLINDGACLCPVRVVRGGGLGEREREKRKILCVMFSFSFSGFGICVYVCQGTAFGFGWHTKKKK
ncbi:hypothetical protein BGW80DRAFT_63864 [Lactifluus volemus]|nr:hypothetical protein BGW80DRAFT_63864 [Lactifluus volemus]